MAPADQTKVAGTFDPNYQTLTDLNNDCFKAFSPTKASAATPAQRQNLAATFDPNYQSLKGLDPDIFVK
ncbi:hypothetical protein L596_024843 [Steinernema carpocapsae]|uniref:Uncharacterized protein n=1 Tax=Steinernema carpocapsae TaxID=34508 RepID=A0A4U5M5Z6_STECR|nr:hypothetical protein L596_024843 [Steinernema carpocapsae]